MLNFTIYYIYYITYNNNDDDDEEEETVQRPAGLEVATMQFVYTLLFFFY